jgi:CRP-like cAMP-binding protein
MNVAAVLKTCPQLSDLSPGDIDVLASAVEVVRGADGHAFVKEGDRGDGCYFVLEGEVGISHAAQRGGADFKTLGPGEVFGVVALIDHGPRSATCRAVGDTTVGRLSPSAFQLLHSGSPALVLHFRKLVARQLARDARAFNAILIAAMADGHPDASAGPSEDFHVTG